VCHDFLVYQAVFGASAYDVVIVCVGTVTTGEEVLSCACLINVVLERQGQVEAWY
jgi:hypothetical protein